MTLENGRLHGQTILITGATSGIGQVAARQLAGQGAQVVIVARNAVKGAETVRAIKETTGNDAVSLLMGDLSVQADVRHVAAEFRAAHNRLDVLINNAGAFFLNREVSQDGIEMTWATNHLNYFLLTNLLLDMLQASAPARIVNVSSGAHVGGRINFDDLGLAAKYSSWAAYSQSKLANVLFTYELARRLAGTGVTATVLHPGFVRTNFARNNGRVSRLLVPFFQLFAISPEKGAETIVYLASSPEVAGVTGQYFANKKPVRSAPLSHDEAIARRLWDESLKMTGGG